MPLSMTYEEHMVHSNFALALVDLQGWSRGKGMGSVHYLLFQLQQHIDHRLQVCSFIWKELHYHLVASAYCDMLCKS